MSDLAFRKEIRAITDALGEGEHIRMQAIYQRLPAERREKPISRLTGEINLMMKKEQLARQGVRGCFEYRSGPNPVVDLRLTRPTPQSRKESSRLGFMALARLQREDQLEFERVVQRESEMGWSQ